MRISKYFVLACCLVLLLSVFSLLGGCGESDAVDGDNNAVDGDSDASVDGDKDVTDIEAELAEDGDLETDGDDDIESDTEKTDPNPLPFEPAGPDAAPDPMEMGPFPVGVTTIEIKYTTDPKYGKSEERTLAVEIWYPATQKFKDGPFYSVDFKEEAKDAPLDPDKLKVILNSSIEPIETKSVRDADLDKGHGPYPLIIFSHGCNGIRWQSIFYTIHLASHGYIVVAPDHQGNTLWEIINEGYKSNMLDYINDRESDIPEVLKTILAKNNNQDDFFYHSVNEDEIGITGHSLGGITAGMAMCQDERYKAVVYHSPVISAGQIFGNCFNLPTRVPTLTMGGTSDKTLPYCGQYCDYKNIILGEQPKYLYQLEKGGHFTFSDICQLDLVYVSKELGMGSNAEDALTDGCSETENAPWQAAHQTIDYYATAFFNLYLRGSKPSEKYLVDKSDAPFDNVEFYKGDVPDWREEGGCEKCNPF